MDAINIPNNPGSAKEQIEHRQDMPAGYASLPSEFVKVDFNASFRSQAPSSASLSPLPALKLPSSEEVKNLLVHMTEKDPDLRKAAANELVEIVSKLAKADPSQSPQASRGIETVMSAIATDLTALSGSRRGAAHEAAKQICSEVYSYWFNRDILKSENQQGPLVEMTRKQVAQALEKPLTALLNNSGLDRKHSAIILISEMGGYLPQVQELAETSALQLTTKGTTFQAYDAISFLKTATVHPQRAAEALKLVAEKNRNPALQALAASALPSVEATITAQLNGKQPNPAFASKTP